MIAHPRVVSLNCRDPFPQMVDGDAPEGAMPPGRLVVDSRGVDALRASNPTFAMLSSVKPFLFQSRKNACPFSGNTAAYDLGI